MNAWLPTFIPAESGNGGRNWVSWAKASCVPAGSKRRAGAEPLNGSVTNVGRWHEVSEDSFLQCSFELLYPNQNQHTLSGEATAEAEPQTP